MSEIRVKDFHWLWRVVAAATEKWRKKIAEKWFRFQYRQVHPTDRVFYVMRLVN